MAVEVSDHQPHLLAALRDELGVTSPRDGCAPAGQRGCCVVLVDGSPRVSCVTTLDRAEGGTTSCLGDVLAAGGDRAGGQP